MPGRIDHRGSAARMAGAGLLALFIIACAEAQSPRAAQSGTITFQPPEAGAVAGAALPTPASVHVAAPDGSPLVGAQVEFSVLSGGGAIIDTVVTTDASGRARTVWILGPTIGGQSLLARAADAEGFLQVNAARPATGATYSGRAGYVVYMPGDLPIILSAPHGGDMRPAEIPDRSWGTTVRDVNTEELTLAIADALLARTGARPHVVIVRLHRTKLDANRDLEEAAQNSAAAGRAWNEFHSFITAARAAVAAEHGTGLYIDVHGHAHAIDRVELGYLVSDEQLQRSDAELNAASIRIASSLRTLVESSPFTMASVLRGPQSLGTLLEARGYSAVPSTSQPHASGEPYFSGGPNARRHGSRDGGVISGMQLEAHRPGVRDTHSNRVAFAQALAGALEEYLEAHLRLTIAGGAHAGAAP